MELKPFKVYALLFPQSDLESEYIIEAKDEEDARQVFERLHPGLQVKRIVDQSGGIAS